MNPDGELSRTGSFIREVCPQIKTPGFSHVQTPFGAHKDVRSSFFLGFRNQRSRQRGFHRNLAAFRSLCETLWITTFFACIGSRRRDIDKVTGMKIDLRVGPLLRRRDLDRLINRCCRLSPGQPAHHHCYRPCPQRTHYFPLDSHYYLPFDAQGKVRPSNARSTMLLALKINPKAYGGHEFMLRMRARVVHFTRPGRASLTRQGCLNNFQSTAPEAQATPTFSTPRP